MGKLFGLSSNQMGLIHFATLILTGANCNLNNVLGNFLVKLVVQGLIQANTTPLMAHILLSRWALLLYATMGSVWHLRCWLRRRATEPS